MSSLAPLNLNKLEVDAKKTAMKHVANMLQRPDQLEKVDQYKRRIARKKASVEAMLKTALQSQLDGVRTGLTQLSQGLSDVKEIKQSLEEIDMQYRSVSSLNDKLKNVKDETTRHRQLAAAVENLKHIFTVPETVKKTQDLIMEGKLLSAHKCLTDLETSRDDLLFELHKQTNPSPTDKNMLLQYFKDVEKLSEDLGKQLWLILQRTLMTVRREPTIIVTALRIIEREERADAVILRRQDQTEFLPPGRPKRWREKCFAVLEESVLSRIEGSQVEDRTIDKMWLVRHLELTRQIVLEDLRVVKTLCDPCFPPEHRIVERYMKMYHHGIAHHLKELIDQTLEGNEIVSLLSWVNAYGGHDLMGHPDLKDFATANLGPLLDNTMVESLQGQYLTTMKGNINEWMTNSLTSDIKDWHREQQPEADGHGYFNTPLPVILFQMIEQNLDVAKHMNPPRTSGDELQVANHITEDLTVNVLMLCVEELNSFARTYSDEIRKYKEGHLQDRSSPKFYYSYMIAHINNCLSFNDFMEQLRRKYMKNDIDETREQDKFNQLGKMFESISREGCNYLIAEVFLDLEEHTKNLLNRERWLSTSIPIDTICITIEDYSQDFMHVKPKAFEYLMKTILERLIIEYIKAMTATSKKISFKNFDERRDAADKIVTEVDQLRQMFERLGAIMPGSHDMCNIPAMLTEVIKLKDTSMLSLELSTIISHCPDVRIEQLVNLTQLRGDISKSDARQLITEIVGEEEAGKPREQGIFTKVLMTSS